MKFIKITSLILLFFLLTNCKKDKEKPIKKSETTKIEAIIKNEHLNLDSFHDKIKQNNAQLVDVRTLEEYNGGHIPNAKLIDFKDANFVENATKYLDKSKPVYVYCLSGGHRSQTAVKLLKEKGYDIHDLIGGFAAWQKKELTMETVEK